jgi:hypothetical protein
VPSGTDKKLWAEAANLIEASRNRCQVAYKSELYSGEVIAREPRCYCA